MKRDHVHRSRVVRKNGLACVGGCLQWLFRFTLFFSFSHCFSVGQFPIATGEGPMSGRFHCVVVRMAPGNDRRSDTEVPHPSYLLPFHDQITCFIM